MKPFKTSELCISRNMNALNQRRRKSRLRKLNRINSIIFSIYDQNLWLYIGFYCNIVQCGFAMRDYLCKILYLSEKFLFYCIFFRCIHCKNVLKHIATPTYFLYRTYGCGLCGLHGCLRSSLL